MVDLDEIVAVGKMLKSRFPNTILSMSSAQAEFGHVEVSYTLFTNWCFAH